MKQNKDAKQNEFKKIKIHKKQFEAFQRRRIDPEQIISGFLNEFFKNEKGDFSIKLINYYHNSSIDNFYDEYLITCPQCKEEYYPVLGSRRSPHVDVQEEFPDAKPWEREQLLSGICSNECWEEFLK